MRDEWSSSSSCCSLLSSAVVAVFVRAPKKVARPSSSGTGDRRVTSASRVDLGGWLLRPTSSAACYLRPLTSRPMLERRTTRPAQNAAPSRRLGVEPARASWIFRLLSLLTGWLLVTTRRLNPFSQCSLVGLLASSLLYRIQPESGRRDKVPLARLSSLSRLDVALGCRRCRRRRSRLLARSLVRCSAHRLACSIQSDGASNK